MKTALNPPTNFPEWSVGSMDYALAHVAIDDDTYRARAVQQAKSDKYLILDNGADELGEGLAGSDFYDLIDHIRPDEVIAPDVLGDGKETLKRLDPFLKWAEEAKVHFRTEDKPDMKVMAVAQGETEDEWMETYLHLHNHSGVDVIGIPYDIEWGRCPVSRGMNKGETSYYRMINRVELLFRLFQAEQTEKPLHLLGLNSLTELGGVQNLPFVRSTDTTAPFAAALDGCVWHTLADSYKTWSALDFGTTKEKWDSHLDDIKYNVQKYLKELEGREIPSELL